MQATRWLLVPLLWGTAAPIVAPAAAAAKRRHKNKAPWVLTGGSPSPLAKQAFVVLPACCLLLHPLCLALGCASCTLQQHLLLLWPHSVALSGSWPLLASEQVRQHHCRAANTSTVICQVVKL